MPNVAIVEETCPECGWKFKSVLPGDALSMVREHRRTGHAVLALLVGDENELLRALEAGWDRRDVILPELRYLQGRRWHVLYISWSFMLLDMNEDDRYGMLAVIQSNHVMMHGDVHVVNSIPNRKDVK